MKSRRQWNSLSVLKEKAANINHRFNKAIFKNEVEIKNFEDEKFSKEWNHSILNQNQFHGKSLTER